MHQTSLHYPKEKEDYPSNHPHTSRVADPFGTHDADQLEALDGLGARPAVPAEPRAARLLLLRPRRRLAELVAARHARLDLVLDLEAGHHRRIILQRWLASRGSAMRRKRTTMRRAAVSRSALGTSESAQG